MDSVRLRALNTMLAVGTALGGASLSVPALAQAQPQPAASGGVEEIVVTARARSEDIEKVPAQVTAFTSEMIEAKGITNPKDFLDAVPNVTFIPTQNAGTSFIVMRGISQARNSEPSAAIVVDGVPMTQPAEFNQELFDIQQIEVLKGPQGALYGRNAIGGAILITTAQPSDEWEGRFTAGADDGPGYRLQGVVSGPVADDLKVRAAASYWNTDGWLTNVDRNDRPSSQRDADPVEDFNARVSALWTPLANFTADLRLSTDILNTRGLYYIIPPFGSKDFNNPDFTSQPINLNNSGKDDRKIYDAALKLSYDTGAGMLTSISGYSTVWEILTGDGYPFDPFGPFPINRINFNFDQSQFLTVKTFSQELRFTSPSDQRFRWIVGGQLFSTDRYISTGNMWDANNEGVEPIYRTPNPQFVIQSFAPQAQVSFLADGQKQFAWAAYADTSFDITDQLELSVNARYDRDHRTNTTLTPQQFLDGNPFTGRAPIPASTGDKRSHTWSAFEPQAILKYQWTENLSVYADYSRGFRSGGFNQTGVATAAAAAGFDNVGDQFGAETANTYEAGFKSRWFDDRLVLNGSVYQTDDHNDYYFVFLASNSTQNLGNIKKVRFRGFDLDATARLDEYLSLNAGFGLTDSVIQEFPGPSGPLVVGSKAPLVSDYTFNLGAQYLRPVWTGWSALIRLDYNLIGPTVFVIP
ncbi:MAG TPA: TonB-dependent receptor, partial [Rhizomicrobium sp.]